MGDTQYDILDGRYPPFKAFFNIYDHRCRPHFLICYMPTTGPPVRNIDKMPHNERVKMVEAAIEVANMLAPTAARLSMHLGEWQRNADYFHIHVCAETNEYIQAFRQYQERVVNSIPAGIRWMEPETYITNVNAFCGAAYQDPEYTDGDVRVENLWYHTERRRISCGSPTVAGGQPTDDDRGRPPPQHRDVKRLSQLFNELLDLYNRLRSTCTPEGEFGCHVVVNLGLQGFEKFVDGDENPVDPNLVQGYLEIEKAIFLTLCPTKMRTNWSLGFDNPTIKMAETCT